MHKKMGIYTAIFAGMMVLAGLSSVSYAADAKAKMHHMAKVAEKEKVVFQVSDADPKKWNLALNNAKNVQDEIGKDKVDIEIVVYGPGIGMLKLDSEVAQRVDQSLEYREGNHRFTCQSTQGEEIEHLELAFLSGLQHGVETSAVPFGPRDCLVREFPFREKGVLILLRRFATHPLLVRDTFLTLQRRAVA